MGHLQIQSVKKTKKGSATVWSAPTKKQLEDLQAFIKKIKDQKKTFKFVENDVEKTYKFNGNNYIVSFKSVE
jgi:hypothetical protein